MARAFVYHVCTTDDLGEADESLIDEAGDLAYTSFPNHTLAVEHLDLFVDRRRALVDRSTGAVLMRSLRAGDVVVFASVSNLFASARDERYTRARLADRGVEAFYLRDGDLCPLVEGDEYIRAVLKREAGLRRSHETRLALAWLKRTGRAHCGRKTGYKMNRRGELVPCPKDRDLCRTLLRLHREGVTMEKLALRFCYSTSTVFKKIRAAEDEFPLSPFRRIEDDGTEVMLHDPAETA